MKKLKGSRTEHNLMAAFAGESQARNRYTFYAGIASKEGHEGIAANFLETAEHEKMHAKRYFELLEGLDVEIKAGYPSRIGGTLVNLEAAATGEHEEWTNIYPTFGKIAEEEGFAAPSAIFFRVAEVEVQHLQGSWHRYALFRSLATLQSRAPPLPPDRMRAFLERGVDVVLA